MKIEDVTLDQPLNPPVPIVQSLVVLLGTFDASLNDKIRSIFSRVVVPVAARANASVVTNARTSGCAPLISLAALEQDQAPHIIGIVENERQDSDIDPSHEYVLRLPAGSSLAKNWFGIAAGLAPDAEKQERIAVFLFGGGATEKSSVLWCARRGWPVIAIGQTGGLADDLLNTARGADGTFPPVVDPDLREILETGSLFLPSVDAKTDDLTRIFAGRIESSADTLSATLQEAWQRYDELDCSAVSKQNIFRRLQFVLIWLAVVAVFLAILKSIPPPSGLITLRNELGIPAGALQDLVIIVPIVLTLVAAYNSHFRDGNKWILLRGASEAVKREIFRFRAQAGVYSDEQCGQTSRESKLIAKLTDITASLEQSEVNKTTLRIRKPKSKNPEADSEKAKADAEARQTILTPEQYVVARIRDQIGYFTSKTASLNKKLIALQAAVLVAGGAGTFLAAKHLNVWVALATAFATALTTKLQTDQTETSLVQYNQTLATLKNIEGWWKALTQWEKRRRINIDLLVDQTEKAMEAETAGWVQQMQSTLDKLTEKESQQGQPSGS